MCTTVSGRGECAQREVREEENVHNVEQSRGEVCAQRGAEQGGYVHNGGYEGRGECAQRGMREEENVHNVEQDQGE